MTAIPARDLRNHTAEVLRRVEAGEEIEVFKDNRPRGRAGNDPHGHDRRSSLVTMQRALADTSVFIGLETARFDASRFAEFEWGVSVVTLGELRLGVLQAREPEASARRLSTYQLAQRFEPLAVDEAVSDAWALLV